MLLYAYDLSPKTLTFDHIYDGLKHVKPVTKFSDAGHITVGAIHGIVGLYDEALRPSLGAIEIYLGRSTRRNVISRFHSHYKTEKSHRHGIPLFVCTHDVLEGWEKGLIKILKRLDDHNVLCVANIAVRSAGGSSVNELGLVYLTWRLVRETQITSITPTIARAVAKGIGRDTYMASPASVTEVLMMTRRLKGVRHQLIWHRDHK